MGFFSGICSFVGSCVSRACSFVGNCISKVGSAISSCASKALNILSDIGVGVAKAVETACKIVGSICGATGVQCEDGPKELGYKASISDKKPEDFDSTQEYIDYLNKEVQLDKEKFDKLSDFEQLGCAAMGMTIQTKAIEEKLETTITPECIGTLTKIQLAREAITKKSLAEGKVATSTEINPQELVKLVIALKSQGINNLNDVSELLEGKGESNRVKTAHAFVAAVGEGGEDKLEQLQDEALEGGKVTESEV